MTQSSTFHIVLCLLIYEMMMSHILQAVIVNGESLDKIRNKFLKERAISASQIVSSANINIEKNKSSDNGMKKPRKVRKRKQVAKPTAVSLNKQFEETQNPTEETQNTTEETQIATEEIQNDVEENVSKRRKSEDNQDDQNLVERLESHGGQPLESVSGYDNDTVTARDASNVNNQFAEISTKLVTSEEPKTSNADTKTLSIAPCHDPPIKPTIEDVENKQNSVLENIALDGHLAISDTQEDGLMAIRPKTPVVSALEGENVGKLPFDPNDKPMRMCIEEYPKEFAKSTDGGDENERILMKSIIQKCTNQSATYEKNLEQAAALTDTLEYLDKMRKRVTSMLRTLAEERELFDKEHAKKLELVEKFNNDKIEEKDNVKQQLLSVE